MTLLSTQWSMSTIMNLNVKNLMMNPAIMNLTMMIITMMRKGCMTLRGTQWHLFTIKNFTRKNITMEMSCMTHLGIQCQNRNISLTSSMRSTDFRQRAETLSPFMSHAVQPLPMMNFTMKSLTIGDLSRAIRSPMPGSPMISKMKSTASQHHTETLTPIGSLTINLSIKNLSIGGDFQPPEDLSPEVGAVKVAYWALLPPYLLD